jgi:DNA-3-methyladenine glycosylase II
MTEPTLQPRHDDGAANAHEAQSFLASLDDPLARLAREHGPVDFSLPSHGLVLSDPLERLTLGIVGQLISVKAALAIFGRLQQSLGGRIDAVRLAECDEAALRSVGLSGAKARAVQALGIEVAGGRLDFDALGAMSDSEVEARLVALRGIGSWSAQMFLLRSMGRPDVFPAGDLGLRRGIESLYELPALPSIPDAANRALAWRPYRSYAAKYLWLHYAAADT